MSRNYKNLKRLGAVAALIQDAALAQLAAANAACEETRRKLKGLDPPPITDSDLPLQAVAQAALLHQRWSEPHRMRLNEQLARQLATRHQEEAAARRCLGRAEVINKLQKKYRPR